MQNAQDAMWVPQASESSNLGKPISHIPAWLALAEVIACLVWIAAVDWLLYQVGTYLAWGVLTLTVTIGLALLKWRSANRLSSVLIAVGMILLGLKLIWGGSTLAVACVLSLVLVYGMALTGLAPLLPEALAFGVSMFAGGLHHLCRYRLSANAARSYRPIAWLASILPVIVAGVFAWLFVLANPDLSNRVTEAIRICISNATQWLSQFTIGQSILWLASGMFFFGILYPARSYLFPEPPTSNGNELPQLSALYTAFRNTLWSVIGLFAIYLVFEFVTLGQRRFPENFYYAGYAHRGAFWLTVALGLATFTLSFLFRRSTFLDPRFGRLKRLAYVWSVENLLLSIAVYNRLFIYIEFNGLTRMRVIGLLGVSCVLAGFVLVVVKLWQRQGFVWLIHRQLWIPWIAIVLYAVLPVDWIVHTYNASQIQRGHLAPSIQIIAHTSSPEGMLPLISLVDTEDATIREGVRAILAAWATDMRVAQNVGEASIAPAISQNDLSKRHRTFGPFWQPPLGHANAWSRLQDGFSHGGRATSVAWQNYQISESMVKQRLTEIHEKLEVYLQDDYARDQAIDAYYRYAYQWY